MDAPLIVCPVPVRSPSHPVEAVDGCDLMELRLDYLRSGHLEAIMESRGLPAVVTIRDPREGGVHPLAEEEKAALLERALGLGFMVDAEMEFLSRHPLGPGGVIASRHVLGRRASWRVLGGDYARASSLGYPIYKAAAGEGDVPLLSRLLLMAGGGRVGGTRVAAMVLGSKAARAALAMLGSALLYCSVGEPTAAGQLSLGECLGLVEFMRGLR
ncbi:hypothetical protein GCM10007981_00450 [Thermocladium modestius]|uniref:3-dehydroquinate dehydratase n=1 Tax=Thermocladium modestius TaxID=62609 RepID=A0A830GTL9_9CREN|nr:type I 3-dehydroquinate dehydratase [Thermocladium modestius]GGP18908.1 hypothetical protein GCM10007981_00450 [Thermocladium modestius]